MFTSIGNIFNISANQSDKADKSGTSRPRFSLPATKPDSFEMSSDFGPISPSISVGLGSILGKVIKKGVEVAGQVKDKVVEEVNNFDPQQKINAAKVTKLLVDNHSVFSYRDAYENKKYINEIAKHDYDKVEQKYKVMQRNLEKEGIHHDVINERTQYLQDMSISALYSVLSYDKLDANDINALFEIRHGRKTNNSWDRLSICRITQEIRLYEDFDLLPASTQKSLMNNNSYENILTENTLSIEEAKNIPDNSPLMKFAYIRDLKAAKSKKDFVNKLQQRRKNIPCKAIDVDKQQIEKVLDKNNIDKFANNLQNTDLTKYKNGLQLEYSRNDYIKDFNKLTQDLSDEDKKKVFDAFQFKITTSNDIINYPNPNIDIDSVDDNIKDVVKQGQELTNKFMLENKVHLAPEDKELENSMNEIIKAFPEFVSVIGKPQHRGDSIDYHTLDDLKRIYSNPEYKNLPEAEQRILTIATLFHDFGKEQGVVDDGHARKSAIATKEIIKKMNLSLDEKERIFNLVNHSHWLTDGSSNEDIAFNFRRPNDFKMAEIFEKADSNSAGFPYEPNPQQIEEIKKNIDFINTNGIPVFANNLPTDEKLYDKTESGVKYIDLRDPEADMEKYGYPKGTKAKDLKFLCHSSSDKGEDFKTLCDDSKEVCLSTSLLDVREGMRTGYNGAGHYIVSGNNANIVVGGKNVSCTGGHRGYKYAKEVSYLKPQTNTLTNNTMRENIPNQIKNNLNLTDSEYVEVYNQICNLNSLNDIQDIKLSNGKTISKKQLQGEIKNIQQEMVRPKTKEDSGSYTNEFVVYNPKIEGEVVHNVKPEQIDSWNKDMVYVLI